MRSGAQHRHAVFGLDMRVPGRASPRRSEYLCGDIYDRKCGRGGIAVNITPNSNAEWQATLSRISDLKFFNYGNFKKNRPHSSSHENRDVTSEHHGVRVVTCQTRSTLAPER
jgi:hypothetical protein